MWDLKRHRATLWSLALHALLLLCLGMLSFKVSHSTQIVAASSPQPSIKAVAVDAQAVQQEVARIQSAEKEKAQAAHRQDLAMRQRQARAAKALEQMQQKKQAIQRELARAKQQKVQAQNALKAMQAKQQALKTLQAKREAQAKQKAQQQAQAVQKAQQQAEVAAEKARVQAEARAGALLSQSMMDRYKALIIEKIAHHWVLPKAYQSDVSCRLRITLGANGEVLGASILQSSGYPALDASARAAVLKASPLPLPKDPALSAKFKVLRLTVKPEQLQNT